MTRARSPARRVQMAAYGRRQRALQREARAWKLELWLSRSSHARSLRRSARAGAWIGNRNNNGRT